MSPFSCARPTSARRSRGGGRRPRYAYGRRPSRTRSRGASGSSSARRTAWWRSRRSVRPSPTRPSTSSSRAVSPSARWRTRAVSASAIGRRKAGADELEDRPLPVAERPASVVGEIDQQAQLHRGSDALERDPGLRLPAAPLGTTGCRSQFAATRDRPSYPDAVRRLRGPSVPSSPRVFEAMRAVDRSELGGVADQNGRVPTSTATDHLGDAHGHST